MPRTRLIVLPAVLAGLCPGMASAQNAGCFADWSIAAPIVRREKLLSVEQLNQIAQNRFAGHLLRTTLCEDGGRFVYRLVVRDGKGVIQSVVVDARRPFDR